MILESITFIAIDSPQQCKLMQSGSREQERAWVKGENEAARRKLLGDSAGSGRRSYGSVVNYQSPISDPKQSEATSGGRNALGAMRDGSSGTHSTMAFNGGGAEMAASPPMSSAPPGYRCLEANSVSLPLQKWYKHIRIPGVFNRSSPHSNAVHTTKYTIITFIPKNLWEQAHRWANLFFIFIALLNFVPAVEAVGKEIGFAPVIFVLGVTAIKDIFEDYRRYSSDRKENGRLCKAYDWETGRFVVKKWSEIHVGDFICLDCDDVIPADILLLHSSDANNICYIETANIDGETNLKQRVVAPGAMQERSNEQASSSFSPKDFTGSLYCEAPHTKIYDFNGYIIDGNGQRTIVNRNHLLLRGCVVRNTTQVFGIVVYAGHDTKALLNNTGLRAKRSKLEKDINLEVIAQLVLLLLISVGGGIASGIWTSMNLDSGATFFPFSINDDNHPALEGFIRFWTFIILYQVIVPISLYVTVEIVKFIQIYFINWDRDMYYAPTDTPFQCRALNISEDLGQIQYVFSDKTGTLTENQMVFRCCSIDGTNYPHTLASEFDKYNGGDTASLTDHSTALTSVESEHSHEEMVDFPMYQAPALVLDRSLVINMRSAELSESQIEEFFITMAICNTVVVSNAVESGLVRGRGSEGVTREKVMALRYEAESPDEAALVEAARSYGYTLLTRSPTYCAVFTPKEEVLEYDVLHVLEFDSERKCMSIVVRERKEGAKVMLYSKGADSAIYAKLVHPAQSHRRVFSLSTSTPVSPVASNPLSPSSDGVEREKPMSIEQRQHEAFVKRLTQDHLDMYARLGLRILCLARRELDDEEYGRWKEERENAELSVEQRDEKVFQSNCQIEQKLLLLGATGIEDRLQEGVPEAIDSLKEAGIKVWVLTGDKQETAINIGYSSHLIDGSMDVIAINAYDMEQCRAELQHYKGDLEKMDGPSRVNTRSGIDQGSTGSDESDSILSRIPLLKKIFRSGGSCNSSPVHLTGKPKALVIDGPTLHFALSPALKCLFLAVAKRCHAVICCRATPLQKAAVVDLVKVQLRQMTLAIGDGANDVSMMQKANVGVGIAGKEGMQAVMASDFAMARFKFLVKLLLVHGHWSYSRLGNMMYYFFYKNVAYALLLFWYQIFCAFSGARVIDSLNLIVFNLIYTSLPIILVAIADQDLLAPTLMRDKQLYEDGRCSKVYTRWKSWLSIFDGVYQSAVIFFVAYGAYYTTDVGITEFGFLLNLSAVVVVSLHLAVETLHWTVVHHVILWGSVVVTFVINYVYTAIDSRQAMQDTFWIMQHASTRAEFWLVLLVTPLIALIPRMVAKVIEQEVFPSEVLKARVKESSKTRRVDVDPDSGNAEDGDTAVGTYDVTPPPNGGAGTEETPPTGSDAPPTRSNAPPTSLPLNHSTNTQPHDDDTQVNDSNHVI